MFKTNAISAVPFKGPVLAAAVYGDLALRQFLDLDVLVHRHDVPRATDLLLSTGYRPQFRLTDSQEAHLLRHDCERAFARDDGTIVELHWDLTPRYFPFIRDPDRLWDRLEPFALGGATVRTLAPDDLLLFLCVHGGKHLWDRLRWIRDVAELLRRRPEIDGAALVVRARALGVERMLLLGLLLASEVLDAPVAEELRRRARADRTVTALAAQVSGRLWRHTPGTPNDPWELRLFHLRLRERWRDRLRYCASVVFTPAPVDWTLVRLPDALYFLYYLIRPVRLAVKYSVRVLRVLTARARFRTAPPQLG